MPIVTVSRDKLLHVLELSPETYSQKDFEDLCFCFGMELDDVTSEKAMAQRERGTADETLSDEVLYKIEVAANRYDLLCLEGLGRALRIFLGKDKEVPHFTTTLPAEPMEMTVTEATQAIRPFVVCAVLRGIEFNDARYKSFIDLQDKLHQNICKRRELVAIGTHDLSTLQPPFTYDAVKPEDIKFVPLNKEEEMDGVKLMEVYEKDPKLRHYLHIIRDAPKYPLITDSAGTVLSLPPIINGDHSKITLNTKDVFIECTAKDLTKAKIVLNMMVTMFAQYCEQPFHVEQCRVTMPDNTTHVFPDLARRAAAPTTLSYIRSLVGKPDLPGAQVEALLKSMQLPATVDEAADVVAVDVPPTRPDVLQECDIAEDVAIALGYDSIAELLPGENTPGEQLAINQLGDLVRGEMAHAGYTEVLTFALCSHDEAFKFLKREDDGKTAAIIANPKTREFQVARPSLLPGMLKTLAGNKDHPLPLRLFEVSDVVLLDAGTDTGARNERRLCGLFTAKRVGPQVIQGMVEHMLAQLGATRAVSAAEVAAAQASGAARTYTFRVHTPDETFLRAYSFEVVLDGVHVGRFGTVHPEVHLAFGWPEPTAFFELNIEAFV